MTQVNISDTKSDLSRLVEMLESKKEDVIYIARGGIGIAQITLIQKNNENKKIGAAVGRLILPDGFDEAFEALDDEIIQDFESGGML